MEALYEKNGKATVVPATAGTIVPNLPEGEEVKLRSDLCAVWGNVLPANTT
jgi:hypothetical protein